MNKNWNSTFIKSFYDEWRQHSGWHPRSHMITVSQSVVQNLLLWFWGFVCHYFGAMLLCRVTSLHICFCVMPVGSFSSDLHSKIASVNYLE